MPDMNETIVSIDLFQDEDEVIVERDLPAYSRYVVIVTSLSQNFLSFQVFSDIGGTAGLVLGLSITSILKSGEKIFLFILSKLHMYVYQNRSVSHMSQNHRL